MAKGIYVGVDDKARKVKKVYVGVDSKARKVKKVYIGVNGIARQCFSAEKAVVYNGTLASLPFTNKSHYEHQFTSGTDKMFIMGGLAYGDTSFNLCCSYTKNFTRTDLNNLTEPVENAKGGFNGVLHISAGGAGYTYSVSSVTAYNESNVKSRLDDLYEGTYNHAGGRAGNYVVVGGGENGQGNSYHKRVYAFSQTGVKTAPSDLSVGREYLSGTSINGEMMVFAGGLQDTYPYRSNVVDGYNANLVRTSVSTFTNRYENTASAIKDFAIFVGGTSNQVAGQACLNIIEVYNKSLVKVTTSSLSYNVESACGVSSQENTLLIGGYTVTGSNWTKAVTKLNADLVQSSMADTTLGYRITGTFFNNYFVFASGTVVDTYVEL